MSNEQKKQADIKITVDNKGTEELVKLLREKEEKKEMNVSDRKLEMYQKTNDPRYLDCQSMDEVKDLTTSLMAETVERKKGTPSGTASLTPAQMGEKDFNLYEHKWESHKQMTDFLYGHMHDDSELGRECDKAVTEMLRKWAHEFRTRREQHFFDPNLRENLPALRITPEGFQVPADENEGDLKKITNRWRMQNPTIRRAVEQLNAGKNPQSKGED
jgi:hypothetical protein